MWTIITSYWVEILLSVVSIIFGFLFGYLFYRLQKRDVASARAERVKRAREELLDLIESYIINKQTVSEQWIHNLLAASEREYQVSLGDISSPTTLLQDVALRLQKSRHLDIVQKGEYAAQIEHTITAIEEVREEVPEEAKEPLELLGVLRNAIHNDEKQKALETTTLLRERLGKPPARVRAEYATTAERWQLLSSTIAGIGVVIATYALTTGLSGSWRDIDIRAVASLAAGGVLAWSTIVLFRLVRDRLVE